MKKTNMKRFLLLFCMLACMFSLTACADTISSDEAKVSVKNMEVESYSQNIAKWASDMLTYLDTTSNEQIKADAEAGKTISAVNGQMYIVNMEGIDVKTIEFYNGWTKAREDLGSLKSVESIELETSKDTGTLCTVVINAVYDERTCVFELVIDEDLKLESGAINPTYTTGEKMVKAVLNTVIGMGVVFIVLIFISFIISLLKYVNVIGTKTEKTSEQEVSTQASVVSEAAEEDLTDDYELVAVITAAIAASEGTSADGLVVRSIKKAERKNGWK